MHLLATASHLLQGLAQVIFGLGEIGSRIIQKLIASTQQAGTGFIEIALRVEPLTGAHIPRAFKPVHQAELLTG
ncbi:hypothetical protein AAHB66_13585 [Leclercia sp. S52]|uniref:hypothetical protein n=1 Tax=Leclercia sp. S52 TaxID=3138178 RepID=UPI00321AA682